MSNILIATVILVVATAAMALVGLITAKIKNRYAALLFMLISFLLIVRLSYGFIDDLTSVEWMKDVVMGAAVSTAFANGMLWQGRRHSAV